MKKNYYFILAALMVFAAACTREDSLVGSGDSNSEASLESSDVTYISAVCAEPGASKANIDDDAKFSWSAGDKVAVYAGGYKISDALAEGGSNAATFVFSGDELCYQNGRANFAVYPASLVFDGDGNKYTDNVTASSLMINLPATYNLSDVKDASAPTPMIAVNAPDGTLEFKSICALLKFTLHSVPKQTKYITFDFNDKKVAGEFEIENVIPGNDATKVENTETEEFDDVITVCNDNVFTEFQNDLVVNVPVPAGEYSKVTITSWDGDPWHGGHKINGITSFIRTAVDPADATKCLAWNAGRRSSGKREIYLPVFSFGSKDVAVGEGTKVVFAPGNLMADLVDVPTSENVVGTATNWRFAEKQYDAVFNGGSENLWLTEQGQTIDLFSWIGSDATYDYAANQKYGVLYTNLTEEASYVGNTSPSSWLYIKSDWGGLEIQGGNDFGGQPACAYSENTWRLPGINAETNKQELEYLCERNAYSGESLLSKETDKSKEYCIAKAQILNDDNTRMVWGVIIFPDHYDIPSLPVGVPEIRNTVYYTSAEEASSNNTLTIAQWEALESVGCVFLPAASYRGTASTKCDNSGDGVYWTNHTKNYAEKSVAMVFCDNTINTTVNNGKKIRYSRTFARKLGASVRLVRQIN